MKRFPVRLCLAPSHAYGMHFSSAVNFVARYRDQAPHPWATHSSRGQRAVMRQALRRRHERGGIYAGRGAA